MGVVLAVDNQKGDTSILVPFIAFFPAILETLSSEIRTAGSELLSVMWEEGDNRTCSTPSRQSRRTKTAYPRGQGLLRRCPAKEGMDNFTLLGPLLPRQGSVYRLLIEYR